MPPSPFPSGQTPASSGECFLPPARAQLSKSTPAPSMRPRGFPPDGRYPDPQDAVSRPSRSARRSAVSAPHRRAWCTQDRQWVAPQHPSPRTSLPAPDRIPAATRRPAIRGRITYSRRPVGCPSGPCSSTVSNTFEASAPAAPRPLAHVAPRGSRDRSASHRAELLDCVDRVQDAWTEQRYRAPKRLVDCREQRSRTIDRPRERRSPVGLGLITGGDPDQCCGQGPVRGGVQVAHARTFRPAISTTICCATASAASAMCCSAKWA